MLCGGVHAGGGVGSGSGWFVEERMQCVVWRSACSVLCGGAHAVCCVEERMQCVVWRSACNVMAVAWIGDE